MHLSLSRHEWSDFIVNSLKGYFHITRDMKKLYHTACLPVQLVHLLEYVVVLQSTDCCYALETNCNVLHYAMPIAMTRVVLNKPWKLQKIN